MSAVTVGVLIACVLGGFAWPRWWLGLAPIAGALAITLYTVLAGKWRLTPSGDNQGAIEFFAIVLLTLAMEGAVLAGLLGRLWTSKQRGNPAAARAAGRAARGAGVISGAFVLTVSLLIYGSPVAVILLAASGVAFVLARAWRSRRS